MKIKTKILFAVFFVLACAAAFSFFLGQPRKVSVYEVRLPGGWNFISEDPASPALAELRRREKLDEIVAGAGGDMEKLQALLGWAAAAFKDSNPIPDYPPWDARAILEMLRSGRTGGFCAQHALLFGQAAQAFGYLVRYADITSADLESDHFVCEVYVPELSKWVVFDAMAGRAYAGAGGVPLSVLELHDAVFSGRPEKVFRLPGREPALGEEKLFAFFQYHLRNNFISQPVYYQVRPLYFDKEREYKGAKGRMVCQWNFEPYKLRYADPRMAYGRTYMEFSQLQSSDKRNFDYALESLSPDKEEVSSLAELTALLASGDPLRLRKITMPSRVLEQYFAGLMKGLPDFEPLARPGDSLRRYERIQAASRE